ncbi:MAG TPA: Gfo/Idh/MocA family oxidoreductase [Planctomycetota bacterium]|nr:Gfo/Idh/MocA family oxidoreductase [Planctomycetota bacterium]
MKRRTFLLSAGALAASLPLPAETEVLRACVYGHTGRGGYGHGLDVCFSGIDNVKVVAVADPDEKGREAAAKRIGIMRTYSSFAEMLDQEKPQLASHGPRWVEKRLEMLTIAAERGVDVYMEKPIALSLEEADAIVAVTEKHGTKIVVAHQYRLLPHMRQLKKLLDEGLIGQLLEIRTRGKEDQRAGGEDLMVLGTHCMYLMRFFAGDPLCCTARVTQDGRDVTPEDRRAATEPLGPIAGDTIHATYAFDKGVQGYFASQKVPKGEGGRFQCTLYGSKGIAHVEIGTDAPVAYLPEPRWIPGKSAWQPLPGAPSNDHPSGLKGTAAANRYIVEELIRIRGTRERSPVDIYEARATLEMIQAVYAAHLSGGRAAFPLKNRKHPLGSL